MHNDKYKLLVNADDFGFSELVNQAVAACFEKSVISSASIVPNMPGFDQACDFAIEYDISGSIGIHVNITEGTPLTAKIRGERNFCTEDGEFAFKRNRNPFLTQSEKLGLHEEVEAQINRCLERGVGLSHLDSHHHVHTEWAVFDVIQRLIRKYGIRSVRPSRNDGTEGSILKRLYKTIFNFRLGQMRLRRTKYCGDCDGFRKMMVQQGRYVGSFEIMLHPVVGENGIVIDRINRMEIVQGMKELIKEATDYHVCAGTIAVQIKDKCGGS